MTGVEAKIVRVQGVQATYPIAGNGRLLSTFIKNAAEELQKEIPDKKFNVWCRGSSGAILAGMIIGYLPETSTISYVRKDHEDHHGGGTTWDDNAVDIFIDDQISGGSTYNTVAHFAQGAKREISVIILAGAIWCGMNGLKVKPTLIIQPNTV